MDAFSLGMAPGGPSRGREQARRSLARLMLAAWVALGFAGCGGQSPPGSQDRPQAGGALNTGSGGQACSLPVLSQAGDPFVSAGTALSAGTGVIHPQEMLVRDDGILFTCGTPGGLFVVDARTPSRLVKLAQVSVGFGGSSDGTVYDGRRCQHLALDGNVLYVAHRGDESQPTPLLAALDVSQTTPSQRAVYTQAGVSFEGLAASGGTLYAAVHEKGVVALSLTGGSFSLTGRLTTGFANAWALAVVGRTLFVADAGYGLVIVDATNPADMRIVGRAAISSGSPQSVVLQGSLAYVAAGAGGVVVVDVADLAQPRVVGSVDTPGSALHVAYANGRLYEADWNDVRIFDLSNPICPALVGREPFQRRILGLAARGDHAFPADFGGRIYPYRFEPGRAAPDVRAPEFVAFARTPPGQVDVYGMVLRNEGTSPLNVADIAPGAGSMFSVNKTSFSLEPGQATAVEVAYRPSGAATDSGQITIRSDDPDEGSLRVPLYGNKPGLVVGDPAPAVEAGLLGGGGTWRLADQRGSVVLLAYFATF